MNQKGSNKVIELKATYPVLSLSGKIWYMYTIEKWFIKGHERNCEKHKKQSRLKGNRLK